MSVKSTSVSESENVEKKADEVADEAPAKLTVSERLEARRAAVKKGASDIRRAARKAEGVSDDVPLGRRLAFYTLTPAIYLFAGLLGMMAVLYIGTSVVPMVAVLVQNGQTFESTESMIFLWLIPTVFVVGFVFLLVLAGLKAAWRWLRRRMYAFGIWAGLPQAVEKPATEVLRGSPVTVSTPEAKSGRTGRPRKR